MSLLIAYGSAGPKGDMSSCHLQLSRWRTGQASADLAGYPSKSWEAEFPFTSSLRTQQSQVESDGNLDNWRN